MSILGLWRASRSGDIEGYAEFVRNAIQRYGAITRTLNIAAYQLFSLRDANSSNPDMFHQFGIMTDAYLPKPAYSVFKDLLTEHVRPGAALNGTEARN
ncbi:hypothetical protein LuPra_02620 [Luteitalea pratensis]|uniref:Uncharacterized protein n=1 Tax=Luteitalea pratensis TaxID=1855912 RepID=A0A143PLF3_LUTPR|nr:hypothetical protein [Luteitalea pratensis]AMY09405.1 hypothetical protein LuPra_02620 [Luteitalea pratensis]